MDRRSSETAASETAAPADRTPDQAATADSVAELQRAVLAPIVAVPADFPQTEARRWTRHLLALPSDALLAEVTAAGAHALGTSLRGSGDSTAERAAAHLPAPWAERVGRAARAEARPAGDPGAAERARARHLVATTSPGTDPLHTLQRLGAHALGDRLGREDPGLAPAVAQRLPPDLALHLLTRAETRR
jgi:hypothetical protein